MVWPEVARKQFTISGNALKTDKVFPAYHDSVILMHEFQLVAQFRVFIAPKPNKFINWWLMPRLRGRATEKPSS